MPKRIMVVGGGKFQVPLCEKIKKMGYELVNTNLYEDSPAFKFADVSVVADVLDMEKNLEIAKQYHIDAVLTDQTDIALPTVAYIAEQLNLPGISPAQAQLMTNKNEMRHYLEAHGFLNPKYALCESVEEAEAFFESLGATMIIKPLDSQASRGIAIINSKEALFEHFEETKAFSRTVNAVLCEQFIDGREFTIDGIFINGKHECLAISKKEHYSYNDSIASSLQFSMEDFDGKYDYKSLMKTHNALMNSIALEFSLTHSEYRYYDGKYYLIEMAARGGGTYISSHIVPALSGLDNYKILIKQALGQELKSEDFERRPKYKMMSLKFIDYQNHCTGDSNVVKAIRGVEEIKSHPDVLFFDIEFDVGDQLHAAVDDRSRLGYYIAGTSDYPSMKALYDTINKTFRVEV